MRKIRFTFRPVAAVAIVALCTLFASHSQAGPLSQFHAARARTFILGLDLDLAKKELQQGDANDPVIQRERGRLQLYEADCDGAVLSLASALAAGPDEDTEGMLDIARGCSRVTAAIIGDDVTTSDLVVRYQDEADRALTPLITESVENARKTLTRDLGVTWPKPTRVIVVRDLLSLAAMTGLPYESAQTTGTVAIAKWGRVTLLSPRASHHGYPWRDTLTHELRASGGKTSLERRRALEPLLAQLLRRASEGLSAAEILKAAGGPGPNSADAEHRVRVLVSRVRDLLGGVSSVDRMREAGERGKTRYRIAPTLTFALIEPRQ